MENNKELDPILLRRMFDTIRREEIKNSKTQKRDDRGMVKVIEEYISRKVKEEMAGDED